MLSLCLVIGGWHWMLTQSAEKDLLTKHCQYKTNLAMQMYDRIKAGAFQQANIDVWEKSIYQDITHLIRQGKLSTAIESKLFEICIRELTL
tara:strand:+ start:379 stop:651 length:273 start_codon:yes stop_codon:yes gene_type:complete